MRRPCDFPPPLLQNTGDGPDCSKRYCDYLGESLLIQKVINGVGWRDDRQGLPPILYDTAPVFVYTRGVKHTARGMIL